MTLLRRVRFPVAPDVATGRVWNVGFFVVYEGEWYPDWRPTGTREFDRDQANLPDLTTPPALLEWYDGWLERCLTDLA